MFNRDIIHRLKQWKSSDSRKPLILRGARQVGKTTVVNEFGKTYANYLYYNMEQTQDRDVMEMDISMENLEMMLYASKGKENRGGDTLLFIDEILNSPKTVARLRYFYEQLHHLHVIAAGSLLENLIDVKVSFPVGRVQYMALRPCSFLEFLGALGKGNLRAILSTSPEMALPFHNELMNLFQQYMLVGGMPEIVDAFSKNKDILGLDTYFDTLVTAYKDDVEKYVRGNKLTEVVRFILSYGWSEAGEAITLGNFAKSSYQSREVGEAFRLLEKAMLMELVYPTSSPIQPVIPETRRKPKLIWFDTGIVNYQAGIRKDIIGAKDILDVWRGRIAEQVVAQELLALSEKVGQRRAYWSRPNNGAEIDFIYLYDSRIIPIEVKNGTNAHLRSIQVFMDMSPEDIAIRIWSGNYSVDNVKTPSGKPFRLVNIPFYMIGCLNEILGKI